MMIDWVALCEVVGKQLVASIEFGNSDLTCISDCISTAAAELRRQRDAAQESGEEGRPEDSWPSGQAPAGIDQRAPSPASTLADHLGRSSAAFSGHEADDLRHERDRLANALAVCGVVARGRRQAYPPEHGSDTLKAIEVLLAERDDARARLAELEPLVAKVVRWHRDRSDAHLSSSPLPWHALVLHERRRAAKERSDGK